MNSKFLSHQSPIKLYRNPLSGHCHRVELMLSFLDIPYEPADLDMANGEHKSESYKQISPFGQIPAIDDNGTTLSDSNAILVYLVKKYGDGFEWIPSEPRQAAEVQRWLSIAAGQIAAGPATARLVKLFGYQADYDAAVNIANELFAVMESTLSNRNFLTGDSITLADVAGYSYVAHAPEGGLNLSPYPSIRNWLQRIRDHKGFIPMIESAIPTS